MTDDTGRPTRDGRTRPEDGDETARDDSEAVPGTIGEASAAASDTSPDDETPMAKVYYEDGDPVVLAAAFVIEDWPWVVGFDQAGTDGYDYVSIPIDRIVGVRSPRYAAFSHNGRRVTAYGVMDGETREFRDLLPL
ncbi:hypothetical protein [Halobaculum magnesiiphilum]|uniref:Uncharacterized protein n=1 Tax=Halobaculum magnesiiphilum TaxID=1017351 RepID=A0A8T8WG89_9EURY|nr:hypothetical protein [Halobaculum magnesiiphilum]QZP38882.1 hypothetical protein K6T50_07040 [Halobaculum magnesiiphilum]